MIDSVSRIKSVITKNSINVPGWRTRRKIVVIESDDWGSIRMPSADVYKKFVTRGFDITGSDYNRLDTLESNDDLIFLFGILNSLKDSKGNPPVVTANYITGNPDFGKIRNSDFSEYYFEPVTKTLERYPDSDRIKDLWVEGISSGIFHPQFHGREHVNVVRWLDVLKEGGPEILYTFENETTFSGKGDYNFMEVLDYNTTDDLEKMKESLVEGLDLFEKIFGFRSKSFIPPCYTWDSNVEEILQKNGVKYIQGLVVQSVPTGSFGNYKRKYHFLGNKNQFGQYFLIRNCFFEPSLSETSDPVGECLNRINIAFRWNKPAVICTHRINFIGSLVEKSRTDNLRLFHELLHRIIKYWPDVEFMTSDQLGDLIAESDKR
jgi:hypothetical protein